MFAESLVWTCVNLLICDLPWMYNREQAKARELELAKEVVAVMQAADRPQERMARIERAVCSEFEHTCALRLWCKLRWCGRLHMRAALLPFSAVPALCMSCWQHKLATRRQHEMHVHACRKDANWQYLQHCHRQLRHCLRQLGAAGICHRLTSCLATVIGNTE